MNTDRNNLDIEKISFTLAGLLLFVYLIIRAIYVPFAHDEASTFFHYVQTGRLIPGYSREALNNHFLNTLLTYLSYHTFGNSSLALRLPNVLSAIIYFIFVFKISRFLNKTVYRLGFLVVFFFAHYFIEFMAVSRGYGLSMAFLMAAFYYLLRAVSMMNMKYHVAVSLFVALMVAANLNLVVPAIAILLFQAFSTVARYREIRQNTRWMIPVFVLTSLLTLSVAFLYMKTVSAYDAFYYGTSGGFVEVTIKSLIRLLTGSYSAVGLAVAVILMVALLVTGLWQLKRSLLPFLLSPQAAWLFVLLASVAGILLVVPLFGVNYPEDRVAVYLFPLFVGSLFFVFDSAEGRYSRYLFILLLPLLFFPLHFIAGINTAYINAYKTEALPGRFYTTVQNTHLQTEVLPTIGGANMRYFSWVYLNFKHGGRQNMVDWRAYPDTLSQFQILEKGNYPYSLNAYDSLDYTPYSGLTLYKRKQPVLMRPLSEVNITESKAIGKAGYFSLLKLNPDTIPHRHLFFNIDLKVVAKDVPFDAWVVIQSTGREGKNLIYRYIPFNWLKTRWDEGNGHFHQSLFFGPLTDDTELINLYIWNKSGLSYVLNGAKVKVFAVE